MKVRITLLALALCASTFGFQQPASAQHRPPNARGDGTAAHPYVVTRAGVEVRPAYHAERTGRMAASVLPPLKLCTDWLHFTVYAKTLLGATAYHWNLHVKWCIASNGSRAYCTSFKQFHDVTNKDSFNSENSPPIQTDEKWYYTWQGLWHGAHYSHVVGRMLNHTIWGDTEHNPWIKAWVRADGSAHATGDADD